MKVGCCEEKNHKLYIHEKKLGDFLKLLYANEGIFIGNGIINVRFVTEKKIPL
jgi:hypothetical protein